MSCKKKSAASLITALTLIAGLFSVSSFAQEKRRGAEERANRDRRNIRRVEDLGRRNEEVEGVQAAPGELRVRTSDVLGDAKVGAQASALGVSADALSKAKLALDSKSGILNEVIELGAASNDAKVKDSVKSLISVLEVGETGKLLETSEGGKIASALMIAVKEAKESPEAMGLVAAILKAAEESSADTIEGKLKDGLKKENNGNRDIEVDQLKEACK